MKNYGYIKDAPHKRLQKSSRELLGTTATFPASASMRPFETTPLPLDQNKCGSCTGHGTADATYLAFAATTEPLPWVPSPRSIYAIVRQSELAAPGMALTDSGAMPADVMAAISTFGVRAIQLPSPQGYNSDVDPSNVLVEEDFAQLEEAGEKIIVGEYRIDETATDFLDQICLALAQNVPVGLGIFVDTAFQNWSAGNAPLNSVDLNDPNGGGHWLCAVGYSESGAVFDLLNSWGPGWGDAGHIQVSAAWMKKAVSDCYAINVARKS